MSIKKFVCAGLAVAAFSFAANAEISPNAIGLRLAGGSLLGGEINYQRAMGSANRLEIGGNVGIESIKYDSDNSYNIFYLSVIGIYQWHWNIAGVQGLNWYAGPGAGVGTTTWSYDFNGNKGSGGDLFVDVGGQVGIEYNFNFPLLLSIDVRPMFGVLNDAGFGWGAGLGVRYTF